MFISNAIKVVGCLMMLFGHAPAGLRGGGAGAAAYSPAKYGILTELLPASQLVKANGWIEGLTIASIILGVLLGGQLVGQHLSVLLLSIDIPLIDTGVDTAAESAIAALILVYMVAAWFNTRIPHTGVEMPPAHHPSRNVLANTLALLPDFWACNNRLWRDKLGQISLSTTTLFWGAGGNLKFIVLAWAAVALGYNTTQASALTGVVAIGTAVGAVVASMRMRLDAATKVIPLGIAMGLLLILMVFIDNIWLAIPFLILLGGLGGYLVVPMNALLQHRGHNLMGAGARLPCKTSTNRPASWAWARSTASRSSWGCRCSAPSLRLVWWWRAPWADPPLAHQQLPPPPRRGGTPAAHCAAGPPPLTRAGLPAHEPAAGAGLRANHFNFDSCWRLPHKRWRPI